MCQKLCKLAGSRQSYSKIKKGAHFFETQCSIIVLYFFVATAFCRIANKDGDDDVDAF